MKKVNFVSRFSLVLIFGIVGCANLKKKPTPEGFEDAMALMKSGDVYKSIKLLELLCKDGHELSCWASGKETSRPPKLSIMQGASGAKSAQFVILGTKDDTFHFYVRDKKSGRVFQSARQDRRTRSHSSKAVFRPFFNRLQLGSSYELAASDQEGKIQDLRDFQTLDPQKKNLRFALASCMQESYDKEQKQQWPDLLSYKPDAIFMIGDNLYVDIKKGIFSKKITPEKIWDRYMESRGKFQIFFEKQLVPVFATWDDHDYGINNGGRDFAFKKESKKIFEIFFPQELNDVVIDHGPGVSRLVRIGGQSFFLLDNRFFRSPPGFKKGQAHFGDDQENWILSQMKASAGPFWLMSGDQFFGGYHPHESYQGNHPMAFDRFMNRLRRSNRRFVFVSGDRHLTEIMKLPPKVTGFQTFELTSSGIHTIVFPGALKKWPNPLSLESADGVMNYMIIDSQVKNKGLDIQAHAVGLGNKTLFKRDLKVR